VIVLVFASDMSLIKSKIYKTIWKIFYHYKPLLRHNSNATDGTQMQAHECCWNLHAVWLNHYLL